MELGVFTFLLVTSYFAVLDDSLKGWHQLILDLRICFVTFAFQELHIFL